MILGLLYFSRVPACWQRWTPPCTRRWEIASRSPASRVWNTLWKARRSTRCHSSEVKTRSSSSCTSEWCTWRSPIGGDSRHFQTFGDVQRAAQLHLWVYSSRKNISCPKVNGKHLLWRCCVCRPCFRVVNKDRSLLFVQSTSPPSTRAVLGGQAHRGQPSWLWGLSRGPEEEETCPGHVLRPLWEKSQTFTV